MKLKIKVKSNSGERSIEKKDDFYVVKLTSSPENNKANIELLKLLKKEFGVDFKIKSGASSRNKVVESD